MKIYHIAISLIFIGVGLFARVLWKTDLSPTDLELYLAWREDFNENILKQLPQAQGIVIGYGSHLSKKASRLKAFENITMSQSQTIEGLLIAKLQGKGHDIGDEFLALAICQRHGWSWQQVLKEGGGRDDLIELPRKTLRKLGFSEGELPPREWGAVDGRKGAGQ